MNRLLRSSGPIALVLSSFGCGGGNSLGVTTCEVNLSSLPGDTTAGIKQLTEGYEEIAQSFTVGTNDITFNSVEVALKRQGEVTGNLTLTIQTDADDAPSGSSVFMSDGTANTSTLSASAISDTKNQFYTFTFANNVTLQSMSVYWVKISASYNFSDTNYVSWLSNSNSTFSGVAAFLDRSSSVWRSDSDEFTGRDLLIKLACTTTSSS